MIVVLLMIALKVTSFCGHEILFLALTEVEAADEVLRSVEKEGEMLIVSTTVLSPDDFFTPLSSAPSSSSYRHPREFSLDS